MASFADGLAEAASRVSSDPIDFSALRDLESIVNEQLEGDLPREECFIAFFLSLFLADVFYNLSGDFPYHLDDFVGETSLSERWGTETFEIRREFFAKVPGSLDRVASKIRSRDWISALDELAELSSCYLTTVRRLNVLGEEIIGQMT